MAGEKYFKLGALTPQGIVQTDKSKYKKAFYNFSFKFILEYDTDIGDAVPSVVNSLSLPIWSNHFVLQNVTVKRDIYFYDSGGMTFLFGADSTSPLPTPGIQEWLKLGFSDAVINTNFPYQDQNMIWIPFSFSDWDFIHETDENYNHRFLFKKQANWLNVFMAMSVLNTGDVQLWYAALNAIWQKITGLQTTIEAIAYRFNILVSGVMDG